MPQHLVEVPRVRRKFYQMSQTPVLINVCGISAKVLVQVYKNALSKILRKCKLL